MVENQYLNDYLKNDDVYEGDVFLPREYAMKDWLFAFIHQNQPLVPRLSHQLLAVGKYFQYNLF